MLATHKGHIGGKRKGDQLLVDKSFHTASGAEADCLVVAGSAGLADDAGVIAHLQVAFRHHKPIAAWGDGTALLEAAGAAERSSWGRDRRAGDQGLRQGGHGLDGGPSALGPSAASTPPATSPPGRPEMPNGIDLILADHRTVDDLFAEFDTSGEATVIGQVIDALKAHDDAEQAALYPLAAELPGRCEAARAQRVGPLGGQAADRPPEGPGGPTADRGVCGSCERSWRSTSPTRRSTSFPPCSRAASEQQLDELGARILQAKQRGG